MVLQVDPEKAELATPYSEVAKKNEYGHLLNAAGKFLLRKDARNRSIPNSRTTAAGRVLSYHSYSSTTGEVALGTPNGDIAYAKLTDVAEIRPDVEIGDMVMGLSEYGASGVVGKVKNFSGTRKSVVIEREGDGRTDTFGTDTFDWWVRVGEIPEVVPPSPEDTYISDWWLDHIRKTARAAKVRNRWCEAYDKVVKELLAPAMASRAFKVQKILKDDIGSENFQQLWDVLSYDDKFVARFTTEKEANDYARKKNDALVTF